MAIAFGPGPGTIAYQALRYCKRIRAGGQANSDMLADCLYECNQMIDSWNALQNAQYFIDDRYFALTVSQQSYTLGPTGDFNTDINGNPLTYRPQRIIAANLVLLTNSATPTRIPIEIVHVASWAQIPVINVPSQVTVTMYVQTTKDNVTLWMFPSPQTGNQIEFFMWPGFPQFASGTAIFDGPPGWQDGITYNLAKRMYLLNDLSDQLPFNQQVYDRISLMAAQTFRVIEGSNAPTPVLNPDLIVGDENGGNGAPFDYLYGSYSQ